MIKFIIISILFINCNFLYSMEPTWYIHESESKYSNFFEDLSFHLPKNKNWKNYSDKITDAHEMTHEITSYLESKYGKECFYVGNNKFAYIESPNITITQVANLVPEKLQNRRFQLYLIDQPRNQPILNQKPLYIINEWNSYINGMTVGLELTDKTEVRNDYALSVKEFTDYCSYIIPAIDLYDKKYDKTELEKFINWNTNRANKIFDKAKKIRRFNLFLED